MLPEVIRLLSVLVFTVCLSDALKYDFPLNGGNYDVDEKFFDESSNFFYPINIYNQNELLNHIHNRKGPSKLFDPSIVPLNKYLDNRNTEEIFKPIQDRKFVGIGDIKNDLRLIKSDGTAINNKEKSLKIARNSSWRTIKDINKLSSPQLNLKSVKPQRTFYAPYKNVDDYSSFNKNAPCLTIAHKIYVHNEVSPNAMDNDDVNSVVIDSNGIWKNINNYDILDRPPINSEYLQSSNIIQTPNNFYINMPCPASGAKICLNPKKEYYDSINLTPTFTHSFWKNIEAFNNVNNQYTNPKSEYSEDIQQVPSENFDSHTYLNSNFPCQIFGLNACLHKQQYNSIPFSEFQNFNPNLFYHESNQNIPTNYMNPNVQNQYHTNDFFIDDKNYENQKNPNKNEEEFTIYKTIHTASDVPKIVVNKPDVICPQVVKNTKHYVNRYIHFMFSKPIHDLLLRMNILTELELQILEYYRSITNEIIGKPNLILKYHNILLKMLQYLQKANLKQRFHNSYTYATNNNNERSLSKTELKAVRLLGLFEKYFRLAKEKLYNTLKNSQYLRTKDFNLYVTLLLNVIPGLGTIENVMNDENSEQQNSLTPYFGFLTQTENDISVELKLNKVNYMIDMQVFCGEMVNENQNNNAVLPLMVVKPLDIKGSQYDNSEDRQETSSSVANINGHKSEEYFYYNDEPHVVELHLIDDKPSLDVQKSKDKKSQEFLTRTTGQAQFPVSINHMDGVFDKLSKYLSTDSGRPNPDKKNPTPANGKNISIKKTFPINKNVKDSSVLSPSTQSKSVIQKKHELIKSVSKDDKNGNKNSQKEKDIKENFKISSSATRDGNELFTTDKSFIPNWNSNVPTSHKFKLNKLNFYDNKLVPQIYTPHATGQITEDKFTLKPNYKIKINDYNHLPETRYQTFDPYVVDHPAQSHPHYKYKPGFDTDLTLKSINPWYNYKNSPSRLNYYRNLLQYNSYKKPDDHHQEILQERQLLKHKIPWNYSYQDRIKDDLLYKRDFIMNTPLLNHHIERERLKRGSKSSKVRKNLNFVKIVDNKYSVPDLIRDSEYNKPQFINTPGYELGPYPSLVEDGNFQHIPFIHKLKKHKQEHPNPIVHGNYFGKKQPYNINSPKSVVDNSFVAPGAIHKSVVNRLNLLPKLHRVDGANRENKLFYGQSSLSSELNKLFDKTNNYYIKEVVEPHFKIATNTAMDKVGQNINNILHKLKKLEIIKPKELSQNTEEVKDLTSLHDEEEKDKHGLIALIALQKFRRNLQEP